MTKQEMINLLLGQIGKSDSVCGDQVILPKEVAVELVRMLSGLRSGRFRMTPMARYCFTALTVQRASGLLEGKTRNALRNGITILGMPIVRSAAGIFHRRTGTGAKKGGIVMGKIYSVPGILGGEDFYDESGQKVGYSVPGIFGGRDFYDVNGQPTGYSVDSVISGENFYDEHGTPTGYSMDGILGGKDYYDASGKRAGWSMDSVFGGENIRLDDDLFGMSSHDDSDGFGFDE